MYFLKCSRPSPIRGLYEHNLWLHNLNSPFITLAECFPLLDVRVCKFHHGIPAPLICRTPYVSSVAVTIIGKIRLCIPISLWFVQEINKDDQIGRKLITLALLVNLIERQFI